MNYKFINRVSELAALNELTKQISGKNILFIKSNSGWGKSKLTERFCEMHKIYPCLKIKVNSGEYDNGYYLYLLAKEIDRLAKLGNKYITQETFILESGILKNLEELGQRVLSKIPIINTVTESAKNYLDYKETMTQYFNNFNDTYTYSNLIEYIKINLMQGIFILNIENIQSIDNGSFENLKNILSDCNNYLLILEYTDEYSKRHFAEIYEDWQEFNDTVESLILQKLEENQIKEIYKVDDPQLAKLLEKEIKKNSGNLKAIQSTYICLKSSIKIKSESPNGTKILIESLSNTEKLILFLISVYRQELPNFLLKHIYTKIKEYFLLDTVLNKIKEFDLINYSKNNFSIKHDYVNHILNSNKKLIPIKKEAAKILLETFLEVSDVTLFFPETEILLKKMQFAFILNDKNIIYSSLDAMKQAIARSHSPETIMQFASMLRDDPEINDIAILDNLNFWLAEMYHSIGNGYAAFSAINNIKRLSGKKYVILRAIILQQIDFNQEAIDLCDANLKQSRQNDSFELTLLIIKLVALYCIGKKSKAYSIFNDILSNEDYSKLFEYGFALRNAEFFFSYKESLEFYKKSINHFKKFKAFKQAASSQVTHSIHLALIGEIKAALDEMIEIEENSLYCAGILNMVYNNQAAILFYRKDFEEALKLLKKTLSLAFARFDIFIILNNTLACITASGNNGELCIKDLLYYIDKYRSNLNEEIIKYAYTNIYKYYEKKDDTQNKEKYFDLAKSCNTNNDSEWEFWLYNIPIPQNNPEYFRANFGYPISFNCNYGIEYDSDLMHY